MKVLIKRIYLIIMTCITLAVSGCASVPALTQDLSNPSPDVRINAAQKLHEIEGVDCAKLIVPLLSDSEADVRAGAVLVLQKTGEAGVKEVIAGAGKYGNINYYKSGAEVISAMGKDGMVWMLEAYSANKQPYAKSIAVGMLQTADSKAFENMIEVIKSKSTGDPLIISAAELFNGMNAERYHSISQAYQSASGPANKRGILELITLMCCDATDVSVLKELLGCLLTTEDYAKLLEIYVNADDAEKEMIVKSVCNIMELDSWLAESLAQLFSTQDTSTKAAISELLLKTGLPTFKNLLNTDTAEKSARNLEILKAMDKQATVKNLTELLNNEEDFSKVAECIMKLGYPEFADGLLNLSIEKVGYGNLSQLENMLKSFASDPRIDARIKTLCASDFSFKRGMLDAIPMENYKAGLKYKAGKGDGKQDKSVILDYDYDEFYDDEKASYEFSVSTKTLDLVSAEKQISFADPGNADTAVYIKTKPVYKCKYYFKSLHKYVKGYRCDYVITIVDLRTKKALGSKTLKGYKTPRIIYDNEVLWSVKKYLSDPPDSEKVDAAIAALLKKYTA